MDRRRQPYVAIDVWHMFSTTSERLYERFGPAGPLAWLGLLAAAKRAPMQGTVTVVNERDFWDQIGLPEDDHRPPMEAFLKLLGDLKQTSRTRSGRRLDVRISNFERWQHTPRMFTEAERKRRKRAQNTADDTAPIEHDYTADSATERRGQETLVSSLPVVDGGAFSATPPQQAASSRSNGSSDTIPESYINGEGWQLPPGKLAEELIIRWPELDDERIQSLVVYGDTLQRERRPQPQETPA